MATNTPTPQSTVNATANDPILEIRDASVTYDDGESFVLDTVSMTLERNEILGVVGESGSGKSMFASAMLDAIPDPGRLEGSIVYHHENGDTVDILELDDDERRKFRWEEVSMVFQGAMSSFNPTMKIGGHFKETLKTHNQKVADGMEFARQLLSDLYLDPERVLSSYPHELSGGMQQRALIALSIVLEPEVLVMDEPTAALDLLMQRSILLLLSNLQEKYDLTMVFITHDLPLVASLADRMGVMYAFQLVEVGERDQLVENAGHPYTRQLLNSTPNIDAPLEEMRPIPGKSPAPINVPSGCSYHPRCSLATEECLETDPDYYDVGPDHGAACHHWEEARSEITLNFEADRVDAATETTRHSRTGEKRRRDRSEEPLLSLENVEVHFDKEQGLTGLFRDPDTVRAVDGITLDIGENDIVTLVGESGCGKTTLGKTIIGLQRPTSGTVEYRGEDVWAANDDGAGDIPFEDIRQSLQIIHQDPGSALNPNRRIVDILSEPIRIEHPTISLNERRERIYSLLERVGMTPAPDFAGRYPHQLSGGEKQRVALSRALLMNPDVILADEAISALDVSLRVEMMDLMLSLQEDFDTSFVFVSHDLSNARYFTEHGGGRIGVMYLGELVEVGPAEELITDPQHPYTNVLRWATPNLGLDAEQAEEPPMRNIDIPDPVDPPSGCRFHTRCPEAREVCRRESPAFEDPEAGGHQAACFRTVEDHEYWESQPLEE